MVDALGGRDVGSGGRGLLKGMEASFGGGNLGRGGGVEEGVEGGELESDVGEIVPEVIDDVGDDDVGDDDALDGREKVNVFRSASGRSMAGGLSFLLAGRGYGLLGRLG